MADVGNANDSDNATGRAVLFSYSDDTNDSDDDPYGDKPTVFLDRRSTGGFTTSEQLPEVSTLSDIPSDFSRRFVTGASNHGSNTNSYGDVRAVSSHLHSRSSAATNVLHEHQTSDMQSILVEMDGPSEHSQRPQRHNFQTRFVESDLSDGSSSSEAGIQIGQSELADERNVPRNRSHFTSHSSHAEPSNMDDILAEIDKPSFEDGFCPRPVDSDASDEQSEFGLRLSQSNMPKSGSIVNGIFNGPFLYNVANNLENSLSNRPLPKNYKVYADYLFGAELGSGSYGKVKEVVHLPTLSRYAVKILKHERIKKIPNGEKNVENESKLLARLRHRNICCMVDKFERAVKKKRYFILEYCVANMQDMLKSQWEEQLRVSAQPPPDDGYLRNGRFGEAQAWHYFKQLIEALEYLQSMRIVHKDIKPANILIAWGHTLKISDFGVAEQLDLFAADGLCTNVQGTPMFQPPEIAAGKETYNGYKADIWAAGVTLYNMLTGMYPYGGKSHLTIFQLYQEIESAHYLEPIDLPAEPSCRRLLDCLLAYNESDRPSAVDVLESAWLTKRVFNFNVNNYLLSAATSSQQDLFAYNSRHPARKSQDTSSQAAKTESSPANSQQKPTTSTSSCPETTSRRIGGRGSGDFGGSCVDITEKCDADEPVAFRQTSISHHSASQCRPVKRSSSLKASSIIDRSQKQGAKIIASLASQLRRLSFSSSRTSTRSSLASTTSQHSAHDRSSSSLASNRSKSSPINRPIRDSKVTVLPKQRKISALPEVPPVPFPEVKTNFPRDIKKLQDIIDRCLESEAVKDARYDQTYSDGNAASTREFLCSSGGPGDVGAHNTTVLPYIAQHYVNCYFQQFTRSESELTGCGMPEFVEPAHVGPGRIESDATLIPSNRESFIADGRNMPVSASNNSQCANTSDLMVLHHSLQHQSDSGYPSYHDVQKSISMLTSNSATVSYKSGAQTDFMKQLNEMDSYDSNFTQFKTYESHSTGSANKPVMPISASKKSTYSTNFTSHSRYEAHSDCNISRSVIEDRKHSTHSGSSSRPSDDQHADIHIGPNGFNKTGARGAPTLRSTMDCGLM